MINLEIKVRDNHCEKYCVCYFRYLPVHELLLFLCACYIVMDNIYLPFLHSWLCPSVLYGLAHETQEVMEFAQNCPKPSSDSSNLTAEVPL